jgi:hypothetical protein
VAGFVSVAVLAFTVGIGTIVYAYAVIEPHLARVSNQAVANIEWAERGLQVLETHALATQQLNAPQPSTVAILREVPDVIAQSAYLSDHAAQTLRRTATTLRGVEDNLGIVLPDEAFNQNAKAMATTAQSLDGLIPMLLTLREHTDTLATDFARASESANELQEALQREQVTINAAQTRLRQTREAMRGANLRTEIPRMMTLNGGLYIGLAILLLGMGGLWARVATLSARV